MDMLLCGGTVVTCDADDRVVVGDVRVRGREIAHVGRSPARAAARTPARVLDARGCAIIPGFVQAHIHLCQALMRGMADDLPLLEWLRTRVWPLEAAHAERTLGPRAQLGLAGAMLAGARTIPQMGTAHANDADKDPSGCSGYQAQSPRPSL